MPAPPLPEDFYTLGEIAEAAGVSDEVVLDLAAHGRLTTLTPVHDAHPLEALVAAPAAIEAVRALAGGATLAPDARAVLAVTPAILRPRGVPVLVSTGLHGLAALAVAAIASLGLSARADAPLEETVSHEPARLVFLATPGPGGGGGGGGRRDPLPAPKAQREGTHSLASPLPARELPPPAPAPKPVEPPRPLDARMLPPVMAPIANAPSDAATVEGVLKEAPPQPSQGTGSGGGAGTGRGPGLGEGDGAGVGDGSGGGMGGGPYRAGSGVEPPRLLREVKAAYTDEARRANISGEVVMEITIRRDGSVSDARILRGLGGGLNERAVAAVRQWRFAPARLKGTPVDVIVEVAVAFSLR
ncbi:MAG: energy transducer TonB [Vicinamibacterales bacterium]